MRELALLRYTEFEQELEPQLTQFAVERRRASDAAKPAPCIGRRRERGTRDRIDWPRLADASTMAAGSSKIPPLEDVTRLSQDVAERLAQPGGSARRSDALGS